MMQGKNYPEIRRKQKHLNPASFQMNNITTWSGESNQPE